MLAVNKIIEKIKNKFYIIKKFDESDFIEICSDCDKVLMRDLNYFRISNTWLHPLREHPVFIKLYTGLKNQNLFKFTLSAFFDYLKYIALWFFYIFIIILKRRENINKFIDKEKKYNIIIVSHIFEEKQLDVENDLYFGDLALKLNNENIKTLIIYINHSNFNIKNICKRDDRIVLPDGQNLLREIGNFYSLIRESLKIVFEKNKYKENINNKLKVKAAIECLSGSTRATCRIGDQVSDIVNLVKPEYIITTYEGHAWERLVAGKSKNNNTNLSWFAYQHGNLFKLQHSLRRTLGKQYDPDAIFCSGLSSMSNLCKSLKIPNATLLNLGSPRVIIDPFENIISIELNCEKTCLIIPDGIESEINFLFEFAINCAIKNSEFKFILRLHPSKSFDEIFEGDDTLLNLPNNIILSKSGLEEDAKKSKWVLYRGSSAIISAVLSGCLPIYLHKDNEININPLYEINEKIKMVRSSEDFFKITSNISNLSYTIEDINIIQNFCKSTYTSWNPQVMIRYIKNI